MIDPYDYARRQAILTPTAAIAPIGPIVPLTSSTPSGPALPAAGAIIPLGYRADVPANLALAPGGAPIAYTGESGVGSATPGLLAGADPAKLIAYKPSGTTLTDAQWLDMVGFFSRQGNRSVNVQQGLDTAIRQVASDRGLYSASGGGPLIPGSFGTSPITPSGPGTPAASSPLGTGTQGGITVTGGPVTAGGSDAGSGAIGSAFPFLDSSVGGFPLVDILLLGGAALGLVYLAGHRKGTRAGKAPAK